MKKETARVCTEINSPVSKVWEALTKPELIKQYLFGAEVISGWKEGGPITFNGEWNGKQYLDKGIILQIDPNKLFRYTYWSSLSGVDDSPENYANITYELSEDINNNNTMLTISQDNISNHELKEHTEKNWKIILENLKNLLEKETVKL